jgi:hypothetical protein
MGGQSSKATINSLNERITEIATNTVASCSAETTQEQNQKIVVRGIFSWDTSATATQNTVVNTQCLVDDTTIQKLQNQVIDTIGSTVSADGIALLPAFGNTTTEQIVNLNNSVRTSLSKSNIITNYNKAIQKQTQEIENTSLFQFGTSLVAVQESKAFAEAVVKSLTDSNIMSAVENHLELQAKSTSNNPLDIIGRAFSSVFGGISTVIGSAAGTVMFVIFIIMITLVGGIYMLGKFGVARSLGNAASAAIRARSGAPQEESNKLANPVSSTAQQKPLPKIVPPLTKPLPKIVPSLTKPLEVIPPVVPLLIPAMPVPPPAVPPVSSLAAPASPK